MSLAIHLSIKKRALKVSVFTVLCCSVSVLHAQTSVLLEVERDVSLGYHDNFPTANTNFNWSPHYAAISTAGASGGYNHGRGLMDFDLSVIPPDSAILGAFLNLTAKGPFGSGPVGTIGSTGQNSCTLRRVTEPWNDTTVTWNTQPAITMQNALPLAESLHPMQNYYSIDVTALVRDMIADPANSHGFMLMLDNEMPERAMAFYSGLAEYPDQRPSLLVIYGSCGIVTGMTHQPGARDGLTVSPNLAAPGEQIRLSMPASAQRPVRLDLVDAAGRMAWNGPITQWPLVWTVPALSAGTYTITAWQKDGQVLGTERMSIR